MGQEYNYNDYRDSDRKRFTVIYEVWLSCGTRLAV